MTSSDIFQARSPWLDAYGREKQLIVLKVTNFSVSKKKKKKKKKKEKKKERKKERKIMNMRNPNHHP